MRQRQVCTMRGKKIRPGDVVTLPRHQALCPMIVKGIELDFFRNYLHMDAKFSPS